MFSSRIKEPGSLLRGTKTPVPDAVPLRFEQGLARGQERLVSCGPSKDFFYRT